MKQNETAGAYSIYFIDTINPFSTNFNDEWQKTNDKPHRNQIPNKYACVYLCIPVAWYKCLLFNSSTKGIEGALWKFQSSDYYCDSFCDVCWLFWQFSIMLIHKWIDEIKYNLRWSCTATTTTLKILKTPEWHKIVSHMISLPDRIASHRIINLKCWLREVEKNTWNFSLRHINEQQRDGRQHNLSKFNVINSPNCAQCAVNYK